MGTVGGRSTDLGIESGDQADPSLLEDLNIHCTLAIEGFENLKRQGLCGVNN